MISCSSTPPAGLASLPPTVPALVALAIAGRNACTGPHRCFYCGAPCVVGWPTSQYVKKSFTGHGGVAAPGSPWVCQGCVLCLRESCTIRLLDGTIRPDQRMRGYSWVVDRAGATAATKAHINRLREICVAPPEPPFAIILSDSGQTHQLYRGRVNHSPLPIVATLEAEPITYRPAGLLDALGIAGRICAAGGKPSLSAPIPRNRAIAVVERYRDGERLLIEWSHLWSTGLGRLAAWLTPKKEVCESAYREET